MQQKHGQHNAAVVAATKVTHCLLNLPTDSRFSTALENATYTAPSHAQSIPRRTHLRWPPFDVLHYSRSEYGLLFHLLRTLPALSIQRGIGTKQHSCALARPTHGMTASSQRGCPASIKKSRKWQTVTFQKLSDLVLTIFILVSYPL
jgi:hypothetical protein